MNVYVKTVLTMLILAACTGTVSAAALNQSQFGALAQNASGYVDGNPIGGGTGYSDIILPDNASIIAFAENSGQLIAGLANCTAGEIVYVNETANVNMTDVATVYLPAGCTLASNRGYNGSAGGRIFEIAETDNSYTYKNMFYVNAANVRFTGLRFEGTSSTADQKAGIRFLGGGGNFVFDNNEVMGWNYAGVYIISTNQTLNIASIAAPEIGSPMAILKHNYVHGNEHTLIIPGYGFSIGNGSALIKGNLFSHNRHGIACVPESGDNNVTGYEASYNIAFNHYRDPSWGDYLHVFDVHEQTTLGGPAGGLFLFKYNTFTSPNNINIKLKGIPVQGATIRNNIMVNDTSNATIMYVWQYGNGNISMYDNLLNGVFTRGSDIYHA